MEQFLFFDGETFVLAGLVAHTTSGPTFWPQYSLRLAFDGGRTAVRPETAALDTSGLSSSLVISLESGISVAGLSILTHQIVCPRSHSGVNLEIVTFSARPGSFF